MILAIGGPLRGDAARWRTLVRVSVRTSRDRPPAGWRTRSAIADLDARRARYVADLRQVPGYIRNHQTRDAHELLLRHRPRPGEDDLREFAWYHLWRRCHTERRTLSGHRGDVYYVEFSPRGDLLASAGKDGIARIWDTTTWQIVREIEASPTEVNVAAFSPDGKTLATVDDEGKLKLWDVGHGPTSTRESRPTSATP